jgi:hypothetical protein
MLSPDFSGPLGDGGFGGFGGLAGVGGTGDILCILYFVKHYLLQMNETA